jgi:hypothetical protein
MRRTPRSRSSAATARLIDDFGNPAAAAAAVKLPASTTRTNCRMRFRSIVVILASVFSSLRD